MQTKKSFKQCMYSTEVYKNIILEFINNDWNVISLDDFNGDVSNRTVYLRHDVDYSLYLASIFAEINDKLGVKSVFCLQTRSKLYNLGEEKSQEYVRKIINCGQNIGLHFALPKQFSNPNDLSLTDLNNLIENDVKLLRHYSDITPKTMSWHNPSVLGKKFRDVIESPIGGLINAYNIISDGIEYFSDSNHRYLPDEWVEIAESGREKPIHVLFHPFQWLFETNNMIEVLLMSLKQHMEEVEMDFLTNHVYKKHFHNGLVSDIFKDILVDIIKKKK